MGSGVLNTAVATAWLKDTTFHRCTQQSRANGLIDSYGGSLVALQGVRFTQSAANFSLFDQGSSNKTAVFFSDSSPPPRVGGRTQQSARALEDTPAGVADGAYYDRGGVFLQEFDTQLNTIKLVRTYCL
jgi:hypothetical protein